MVREWLATNTILPFFDITWLGDVQWGLHYERCEAKSRARDVFFSSIMKILLPLPSTPKLAPLNNRKLLFRPAFINYVSKFVIRTGPIMQKEWLGSSLSMCIWCVQSSQEARVFWGLLQTPLGNLDSLQKKEGNLSNSHPVPLINSPAMLKW